MTLPRLIVAITVLAIAVLLVARVRESGTHSIRGGTDRVQRPGRGNGPNTSSIPTQRCPVREERLALPTAERIAILERLGQVPDDGDASDYKLAEKTSWWGRRLTPGPFWSNRVVWCDAVALSDARRRGRGYPPVPYEDPDLLDRSDVDRTGASASVEGPNIHYVSSSREAAFWDKFMKKHPHPPNQITEQDL